MNREGSLSELQRLSDYTARAEPLYGHYCMFIMFFGAGNRFLKFFSSKYGQVICYLIIFYTQTHTLVVDDFCSL